MVEWGDVGGWMDGCMDVDTMIMSYVDGTWRGMNGDARSWEKRGSKSVIL